MCARTLRRRLSSDLPQAIAIAEDERRLGVRRDRPAGVDERRGLHGFADDVVQRRRAPLERTAFVEPREEQQVVYEQAHALRFARNTAHRSLEIVRAAAAPREKNSA